MPQPANHARDPATAMLSASKPSLIDTPLRRLNPHTCASCRVLVMDNQPLVTQLVGNMLRSMGFRRIDTAENGAVALKKLRESDFNLVIADYMSEPIGGIDLLLTIRADEQLQHLPVLIMSSSLGHSRVFTSVQAGASAYLLKPFRTPVLADKLGAIFKARPELSRAAD